MQGTTDIDTLVMERFPQPLAVAWEQALRAEDGTRKARLWRRAGRLLVRVLALLTIADFVRGAECDDVEAKLQELDKVSLALWIEILQLALPVLERETELDPLFPELLASVRPTEPTLGPAWAAIMVLGRLDDTVLDGDLPSELAGSYRSAVRHLAREVAWLERYPFVHLGSKTAEGDGRWRATVRAFQGVGQPSASRLVEGKEAWPFPGVHVWDTARGRLVSVSAFFRYVAGSGFTPEGLYVFRETWRDQVFYDTPLGRGELRLAFTEDVDWIPLPELLEDTGNVVEARPIVQAPTQGSLIPPEKPKATPGVSGQDSRYTDSTCRHWIPHPIASLYAFSRSRHEPLQRYTDSLQLVEGILHFLVLINLADGLVREPPSPKRHSWLKAMRRPTMGGLIRLLGETSSYLVRSGGPFLQELTALQADREWHAILERICKHRNDLMHHRSSRRKGSSGKLYEQLGPDLGQVLQRIGFLTEYQLGVAESPGGEGTKRNFQWYSAVGASDLGNPRELVCSQSPPVDVPLLLDTCTGQALVLEPWFRMVCPDDSLGPERLLWYSRVEEGIARYAHWVDTRVEHKEPGFQPTRPSGLLSGRVDLHLAGGSLEKLGSPTSQLTEFGGYTLIGKLGRGGMAQVWDAVDGNGRPVAIKIMDEKLADTLSARKRFAREGYTLGMFDDHPGIVDVYHPGQTPSGLPFLPMERIEGEDLQRRMDREGPFGLDEAVAIMREVLELLDVIHARGVFHRDVKPSNFMLAERGIVMIDFGIALPEDGTRHTHTVERPGTHGFMAPEAQARRAKGTRQMDVYSAGALFYALLTGHAPPDRLEDHLDLQLADVPTELRAVIRCALSSESARRFPSAKSMHEDMEEAMRRVQLRRSRGPFLFLTLWSEKRGQAQLVLFPAQPLVLGPGEPGRAGLGLEAADLDAVGVSGDFVLFSPNDDGSYQINLTGSIAGSVSVKVNDEGRWITNGLWENAVPGDRHGTDCHELQIHAPDQGHIDVGATTIQFFLFIGRAAEGLEATGLIDLYTWMQAGGRFGESAEEE